MCCVYRVQITEGWGREVLWQDIADDRRQAETLALEAFARWYGYTARSYVLTLEPSIPGEF